MPDDDDKARRAREANSWHAGDQGRGESLGSSRRLQQGRSCPPPSIPSLFPRAPEPPPKSLSPAPVSVPTSEAEREAARLRAERQDLLEQLREAKRGAGAAVDIKLRGLNIAAIVTALGGLGLGANATLRQAKAPPEAVQTQGVRLADNEQEAKQTRESLLALQRFERERAAVQACRDGQIAAAFYRLGYRITSLPRGDVHWLSEYKDDANQVRKAPQYRPEDDCPDMPSPPNN